MGVMFLGENERFQHVGESARAPCSQPILSPRPPKRGIGKKSSGAGCFKPYSAFPVAPRVPLQKQLGEL